MTELKVMSTTATTRTNSSSDIFFGILEAILDGAHHPASMGYSGMKDEKADSKKQSSTKRTTGNFTAGAAAATGMLADIVVGAGADDSSNITNKKTITILMTTWIGLKLYMCTEIVNND